MRAKRGLRATELTSFSSRLDAFSFVPATTARNERHGRVRCVVSEAHSSTHCVRFFHNKLHDRPIRNMFPLDQVTNVSFSGDQTVWRTPVELLNGTFEWNI